MESNNLWSLSVAVTSAAMGHIDRRQFSAKCDELYNYFYNNLDEIVHEDRIGFHVGSAFYFMGVSIEDKDSDKYKFAMLVSFLNLYAALPIGDIQACIAAHRLFILLSSDKSFFDTHLLAQSYQLQTLLNPCPDNVNKRVERYKLLSFSFLNQFIIGDGSVALSLLNTGERESFMEKYGKVADRIEFNPNSIRKGNIVFNAIKDELVSAIDGIRKLGIII